MPTTATPCHTPFRLAATLTSLVLAGASAACAGEPACDAGPALSATVASGSFGAGTSRLTIAFAAPLPDSGASGALLSGVVVPAGLSPADRAELGRRLAALAGTSVRLFPVAGKTGERPDRRGRLAGLLALADGRTLSDDLLQAGLVVHDGGIPACADAFSKSEALARRQKRGIWSAPTVLITDATDAEKRLPDFFILRGRVLSVGHSGRTTYLNFGLDRKKDVTVRIGASEAEALAAAGNPVDTLEGRTVEARGWVEAHDGPDLRLTSAAALEVVADADND